MGPSVWDPLDPAPLFGSICKPSWNEADGEDTFFYGARGTYCAPCPSPGSVCSSRLNYDDPYSEPSFWRLALDVTSPRALDRCDKRRLPPTLLGEPICRPMGSSPAEDVNARDAAFPFEYCACSPDAPGCLQPPVVESAVCPDFVACEPRESCTGNNTCDVAYRFVLYQCEAKRKVRPPSVRPSD